MNNPGREIVSNSNQNVLKLVEISILLNSYDDIFSDFDPSEYSERILSDDFIIQANKFSKDKNGHKMSLNLLLPVSARNEQDEKIITKRLHAHFKDTYQLLKNELKKSNQKGILLTAIGASLMILASYLSYLKMQKYPVHLLLVLSEPAGWFLLWAGLDHLVYQSKNKKKEFEFYSKMAKSEIKFLTY